ncbi:MAG: acyltransferase [Verrucomicrobia bacterium]|nr:acyltransferase [Verrucomicrobiota bacterium]
MSDSPSPNGLSPDGGGNSLSFLRFVLAATVIYSHSFQLAGFGEDPLQKWSAGSLSFGGLAVHAFFTLSGFLIGQSWQRLQSLPTFLWHRALRIFPGLWGCLALTAFGFAALVHFFPGRSEVSFFGLQPGPLRYLLANLVYPRGQIVIGDLLTKNPFSPDWNGPLWTLPYEVGCYLLLGLAGWAGWLTRRRTFGLAMLGTSLALALAVRLIPYDTLPELLAKVVYGLNREMCFHFLAGVVWSIWFGPRGIPQVPVWAALAAAGALVCLWPTEFHYALSVVLLPLVVFGVGARPWLAGWEGWLKGDYSYGLYIYGWPVQQVLLHFGLHSSTGCLGFFALSLGTTLLFAALSWHLLERPALARKHRGRSPVETPASSHA